MHHNIVDWKKDNLLETKKKQNKKNKDLLKKKLNGNSAEIWFLIVKI